MLDYYVTTRLAAEDMLEVRATIVMPDGKKQVILTIEVEYNESNH